ncbi:hypothetical protein F4813DRAFT_94991 [Daldinia decipiens]|uniref:uncharacterized protein n=1 Tax=Daldinia decipiens TaxID=326647 RepID=UPI0020C1EEAE|nr:uncharacterized protein F4813DRAFT_94991 [Daldinia decipiens]KAI1661984.1 hypothetical protein F4813DRAFT_94991 [Daldinia decipiens]
MLETPTDVTLTELAEVLQVLLDLNIPQTTIDNFGLTWLRSYLQAQRPSTEYPKKPPKCFRCLETATRYTTSKTNTKGNGGRPYFKCDPCNKFLVFADYRGNYPRHDPQRGPEDNICHCSVSTKRLIAGRDKNNPGQVFYVCRQGTCDAYIPCVELGTNRAIKIALGLQSELAELCII